MQMGTFQGVPEPRDPIGKLLTSINQFCIFCSNNVRCFDQEQLMLLGFMEGCFGVFGESLANKVEPLRVELEVTILEIFKRCYGNSPCLLVILTHSFRIKSETSDHDKIPARKTLEERIPCRAEFRQP